MAERNVEMGKSKDGTGLRHESSGLSWEPFESLGPLAYSLSKNYSFFHVA